MNNIAMIENRKSVRAFRDTPVTEDLRKQIQEYYAKECRHLVPEIESQLMILGTDAQEALEGTAGYQEFLVGAPNYLVLLTGKGEHAVMNAGYMMEDLILKLVEMGLDSCWVTFTDSDQIKSALKLQSDLSVAAIVAFGYGKKTARKLRINIKSMSNIDVEAKRAYYSPRKDVYELVSVNELGKNDGLDEKMGFYEDMLWQSFYAASRAPSYLNRQPYAFLMKDNDLLLIQMPDAYTDDHSAQLDLGIVLLHFSAVATQWANVKWDLNPAVKVDLPEGAHVVASMKL